MVLRTAARSTIARRAPVPRRRPWPARFRPRTHARRGCGIPGYRRWRGSRQSPDGGTRSDRARAPDHASAGFRSWTWLLLVVAIPKIVISNIVISNIVASKIAAPEIAVRKAVVSKTVAVVVPR